MQILSVASEIYPLIKTGGLADVAGALPLALAGHGIETKTLIPGYPAVMRAVKAARPRMAFDELFGARATVLEARHAGLDLLILDAPELFDRPGGPYLDTAGMDYPDNWRRFAALARAGAEIALGGMEGWRPELVHVHDWQAGLLPSYLRYAESPAISRLMKVHRSEKGRGGKEDVR